MAYSAIFIYCMFGLLVFSLLLILSILVFIILMLIKKDKKESYMFLKNIVYGIFGGLIVTVFLDVRGETSTNLAFWIGKIFSTTLLILIFILIGFVYLFLLKKLFDKYTLKEAKKGKGK